MSIGAGLVFVPNGLLEAVQWIEGKMLGSVTTETEVLVVAGVGPMLLQGGLLVEDGMRVAVRCFMKFGAAVIAHGLASIFDRIRSNQQLVIAYDN